jgi:hypothetical protein
VDQFNLIYPNLPYRMVTIPRRYLLIKHCPPPRLLRHILQHEKVISGILKGFVAQIVLKTFLPLPQTDSAYGFCLGYAKSGEAI